MINIPPQYYGYRKDTWADITICEDCKRTSLYEDQHPAEPCPDCGGVVNIHIGKWHQAVTKNEWPPLSMFSGGWFRTTTIKQGYWEVKHD